MIFRGLPYVETHADLFFKYRHPGEQLGHVKLSKSDMHFLDIEEGMKLTELDKVKNFLTCGIQMGHEIPDFDNDRSNYFLWKHNKEDYIKSVWLAKEFVQNNRQLKYPIGAHWIPDDNKWEFHPGGVRVHILRYFDINDYIECVAFNTGGEFELPFEQVFNSHSDVVDYYKTHDVVIAVTSDHGSLIPHVHFGQIDMYNHIRDYSQSTEEFFKTTKINFNFDANALVGYNSELVTDVKREITIELADPTDIVGVVKAFILAPSFNKIDESGVKIYAT